MPKEKILKRLSRKNLVATPNSGTTTFINYDNKTSTLEVGFVDGIYRYFNVPPEVWKQYKALVESGGSSGQFVNFIIKPAYEYKKFGD
jgi:hypothetical protein